MRKICVFTGTRAEYGLLTPLMREIADDPNLILQILVSGMHLSPEFGQTFRNIEADGFHITEKVEILLSSDSPTAISKSVGLGLISFSDALIRMQPDLLVILGDRFEAFAAAASAMLCRIPIAHIHGGEATYGLIDEPIRHSITKMSHLHFTSTAEYQKRVIQLGEHPDRVFNVGALGVEAIQNLTLLGKDSLEKQLHFSLQEPFIIVTFHPITLEYQSAGGQFKNLLKAINKFPKLKIIFTKANADTDGRIINQLIDEYQEQHREHSIAFSCMGQLRYLSAMKYAQAVVGNSSSGIIEAPSFNIPTINIGDRQKGRLMGTSIINCRPVAEEIEAALRLALSPEFSTALKTNKNPYEKAGTAMAIKEVIKRADLSDILKKEFYDLQEVAPGYQAF